MSPSVIKAALGACAWIGFVIAVAPGLTDHAWSTALLLFAALVLVPLALDLFAEAGDSVRVTRLFALARRSQLPAALLLAAGCALPPGSAAATLALPWIAFTGLLGAIGFCRVRETGLRRPLDGLCTDAALLFATIGGLWTLSDRVGFSPLGFGPVIVALTAVHFHYAGLLLPLFAGQVQREFWIHRFAARAAVGAVLGVPAVAVGITTTQLGWGPSIEAAAGCGLALAGMAVAILHVRIATESARPLAARILLGIAGASLFFGMVLASLYAIRAFSSAFAWLTLPQMRAVHGTVNAFGFGLCGVLGWRVLAREAASKAP